MTRVTVTSRILVAGCYNCKGNDPIWSGGPAQGTAALHHDRTGHATWCDIAMSVRYGTRKANGDQLDIETAIESAAA